MILQNFQTELISRITTTPTEKRHHADVDGPHLWREGFVLIQPVGVLHSLVVHLLDDVSQQGSAGPLVEPLRRPGGAPLLRTPQNGTHC